MKEFVVSEVRGGSRENRLGDSFSGAFDWGEIGRADYVQKGSGTTAVRIVVECRGMCGMSIGKIDIIESAR